MDIIYKISDMQELSKKLQRQSKTIGFVPTMGYLHDGHLMLVKESKKTCHVTVVSIFVNPIQFGPKEDLAKYPRDFERDRAMLVTEDTDILFYPSVDEMYPDNFQTFVSVEKVTQNLCGYSRPGHFRGVATVVTKLFNAVMPDVAFFGQKDYQQLITIKRMVYDLNIPVKIIGVPIVREADGLAMSSRNTYLKGKDRENALCLYKSIVLAHDMVKDGIKDAKQILQAVESLIKNTPNTKIDYVKLCNPDTLEYIDHGNILKKTLLALAVYIGSTRLIDNTILEA